MRDGGGGDGGVVGLVDGYVLGVVVGADLAVGGGLGGGLVCGLGFHFAIVVLGLVSVPVGLGCHGLYISCPGPGMSGGWVRRHFELGEWERFRFCTLSFGYITFYHQDQKMFGPLKLSTPVFSLPGLCLVLSPVTHGG